MALTISRQFDQFVEFASGDHRVPRHGNARWNRRRNTLWRC